jgi:hypothetical protein
MKRKLFSPLLYAILACGTPAIVNAQDVGRTRDTTKVQTLSEIVITTEEKGKEENSLEKAASSFTTGNPNWKLYLTTPELSSAFPGFSPVFKYIPLGTLSYRHGIPLLSIRDLNYSLVSKFSDFPIRQTSGLATAETPSTDLPINIEEMPIRSELFFETTPLQTSGGFGYNSGRFKAALSAQSLGPPEFLPENIKDYLKPFGDGRREFFFGEINGNREKTTTRFSLEAYNEELDTDLTNQLNVGGFNSHDGHRYLLFHGEKREGDETLEATFAIQSGASDIEIGRDSLQEKIHQDMTVLSVKTAVKYPSASFSMGLHTIDKTNVLGARKQYMVAQASAGKYVFFTPDFALHLTGRLDIINERETFPRASVSGSLEKRISNLKIGVSAAFLQSAINSEILKDPLTDFSPSPNVGVEQIAYGQANLELRLGNHLLKAEAGTRNIEPHLLNEAKINGYNYFLSYSWANSNSYLTAVGALRFFRMKINGEINPVYMTPREEVKIIAGTNFRAFNLGTSLTLQGNSYFPIEEDGELKSFNLGKKAIWVVSGAGEIGAFYFGINFLNIFELSEGLIKKIGILDNFSNSLAVYGEERNKLEMPGTVKLHAGLRFRQ